MKGLLLLIAVGLVYGAPPLRDQDLCGACYLLMGEVQTMVADGATQDAVVQYTGDVCKRLSSDDKDVCKLFLQVGSASVFKQLLSDLKPQQFCENVIQVCPRAVETPQHVSVPEEVEEEKNVGGIVECELCKLVILAVDKLVDTNRSVEALNSTLEKVCASLPDKISPICKQLEPVILNALAQGLPPDIACKLVKLCLTSEVSTEPAVPCDVCHTVMEALGVEDFEQVCQHFTSCVTIQSESEAKLVEPVNEGLIEDSIQCQLCKFVVVAIDKLVEENATRADINETLLQLCNGLPGELKDTCLNVEPDIVKAVVNGIDPKVACDFIKACNDDQPQGVVTCSMCKDALESVAGEAGVAVCYELTSVCGEPERQMDLMKTPVEVEQVEEPEEIVQIGDDARCELCKLLVTYIDQIVADNGTLDKLNTTLYGVCDVLPAQFKTPCLLLVPTLEAAVSNGVDPATACIQTKFCVKAPEGMDLEIPCSTCQAMTDLAGLREATADDFCRHMCSVRVGRSLMSVKVGNLVDCELCKILIRTLDNMGGENQTKQKVNQTLFEVCERLTGKDLQQACEGAAPKLLALLNNGVDPAGSCKTANLCPAEDEVSGSKAHKVQDARMKVQNQIQKQLSQPKDLQCDLCEQVVTFIDVILGENETDAAVKAALQMFCSSLDASLQPLCKSIVPEVLEVIEKGVDPEAACIAAKLCTGNGRRGARRTEAQVKTIIGQFKDKATKPDDLKCDVCDQLVKLLDIVLAANETDSEIQATLMKFCDSLAPTLKPLCQSIVPEVLFIIETGVAPNAACIAIKQCTASGHSDARKPEDLLKFVIGEVKDTPNQPEDLKCDVCAQLITILDTVLAANETDSRINATLFQFCDGRAANLIPLCRSIVPEILAVVEKGVAPKAACAALKLCPDGGQANAKKTEVLLQFIIGEMMDKATKPNDLQCELCEQLITYIDGIIADNATDEKINATLLQACDSLPGTFKTQCLNIVPQIMAVVEKGGVDPETACTAINLCTDQRQSEEITDPDNLECELCEQLISFVDKVVGQNATVDAINATLYQVCNSLPAPLQPMCVSLVPQVLSFVEEGVDPETACTDIKVCTQSQSDARKAEALLKVMIGQMMDRITQPNDLKCELCEQLITYVDTIIADNATDDKINATLLQTCDSLPAVFKTQCLNIVPQIMTVVEKGVDPKTACAAINLCTDQSDSDVEKAKVLLKFMIGQMVDEASQPNDLKCELCEQLITYIDGIIADNATDEKINATLYQACASLPAVFQTECLNIVPQIMTVIEKGGLDPKAACTSINLCTDQSQKKKNTELKGLECELCEQLITFVDKVVGENATEEQINATLNQICESLPDSLKPMCDSLIPQLLNFVVQGVDPKTACTAINVCTQSTLKAKQGIVFGEDSLQSVETGKVNVNLMCDLCKAVIQEIDSVVEKNTTKKQLNDTVYEECDRMVPTFKDMCLEFAPDVVDVISKGIDPNQACNDAGLCTATVDVEVSVQTVEEVKEAPNDLKCELCQDLIGEVDKFIDENSTIDQINTTIYTQCMKLSGALNDICLQFAPQLVSIIAGGVDPKEACDNIGLCAKQQADEPAPQELALVDSECDICELVVQTMRKLINDDSPKRKVSKTVHRACAQYTGNINEMCLEFAPMLMKSLLQGVDPGQICSQLKICKTAATNVQLAPPPVVNSMPRGLNCESCIHALDAVHRDMERDFAKVKRPLMAICQQFPAQYINQCAGLVGNERYLKSLLELYSPTALCELAHCGTGWVDKGDNSSHGNN